MSDFLVICKWQSPKASNGCPPMSTWDGVKCLDLVKLAGPTASGNKQLVVAVEPLHYAVLVVQGACLYYPGRLQHLQLQLGNNLQYKHITMLHDCIFLTVFCCFIQLNFVKANFIKTNNSVRRSESSVPNRILLILTKILLFKSKYLCLTFYLSKHILRSRSDVFLIKQMVKSNCCVTVEWSITQIIALIACNLEPLIAIISDWSNIEETDTNNHAIM